jgi:hypothetical protein
MPRLLIDNFETTLGADITTTGATSLTLASGQGARLAALTLSATNYLPLTITNGTDVEVVHATARTTDTLTIVRAREGTTALTFPGDPDPLLSSVIGCYPTAATFGDLPVQTAPLALTSGTAVPSAVTGVLQVYARTRAGRSLLEVIGPSGVDTALQPALFGNRVMLWVPGSGTGIGSFGLTPTTGATLSHPAPANTTLAESLYRTRFATSTTAGNAAGVRDAVNTIWRGNSAGRGGFFLHHRFCSGSISLAGGQKVSGLSSSTGALAGEPSALPDVLGVIKDSGDTNWQFARRAGTGTVQKVSLGVAPANNQTFDLVMFSRPNGSEIFVRVVQHLFDGTFTVLLDTSYTTDIPAAGTLLSRTHQVRNGTTAAADNFELVRSYVESDY